MVDASLRATILDSMLRMRDARLGISIVYITHDLTTAYQIGDEIVILYAGRVAEAGEVTTVLEQPKHPYVQLLIDSVPMPDPGRRWAEHISLPADDGPHAAATGCRYAARCPHRMSQCVAAVPDLYPVTDGHRAACYLYEPGGADPAAAAALPPTTAHGG